MNSLVVKFHMRLFRGTVSAFVEVISLLKCHRDLVIEMARREISERYSGQVLGTYWAIGHPLFLIGLYVFIFAFVFKQKIGGTVEMPLDYTTYLLSGLVPWMTIQEVMNKSCTSVTSNSALVKQTIFPLEALPAKGILAALPTQCVSLTLLLVYVLGTHGSLPWTYLLLPVVMLIQIGIMLGIAFFLSSVGVFLRDTKDVVQLLGVAGMYLLPIFYLPTWVPEVFKPFLYLNPFSYLVWCYQDVLYFGQIVHPWAWGVAFLFSFFGLITGYKFFRKMKLMFGNVL